MLVGVEGTGSYGAGLNRVLAAAGIAVVEVDRPDRSARRAQGKSDPLDAYAAARAAASGRAAGTPKSRDGIVESIRCLRVAHRSAVKARTQCINQIRALLVNGPADLREQMRPLSTVKMVKALARLRPGSELSDPFGRLQACAAVPRATARDPGRGGQGAAQVVDPPDQTGRARVDGPPRCRGCGRSAAAGHRG